MSPYMYTVIKLSNNSNYTFFCNISKEFFNLSYKYYSYFYYQYTLYKFINLLNSVEYTNKPYN